MLEKYSFGYRRNFGLVLVGDIDFASKQINIHRQIIYIANRGYFFTTLKSYVVVDYFLLGELKRWQSQQVENEKSIGDNYFYIYREDAGHIERMSKKLPVPDGEKVSLVCTRNVGRIILKNYFTIILAAEGLNAHSFRHTHATQLIENGAVMRIPLSLQNLYTHSTLKLQEETVAIFDKNLQTE